jgi:hypothetical protein
LAEIVRGGELLEHEFGSVRAGDRCRKEPVADVGAGAVGAFARTIGERGGTDDHPIEMALPDEVLLYSFVREQAAQKKRDYQKVVEKAESAPAVCDAERRLANEALNAVLFHGADDVARGVGEFGVAAEKKEQGEKRNAQRDEPHRKAGQHQEPDGELTEEGDDDECGYGRANAESGENHVLAGDGGLNGVIAKCVALRDTKIRMRHGKLRGVANERSDLMALRESLFNKLAPGAAAGTKYEELHNKSSKAAFPQNLERNRIAELRTD